LSNCGTCHHPGLRCAFCALTGISGAPIKTASFQIGLDCAPDLICADSGSCDVGPGPLGADVSSSPVRRQRHDLEHMLLGARRLGVPMTLATSGGDCVFAWSFTGGGPMGKPPLEVGSGLGRLVTSVAVHPKNPIVAAGFDEGQVIVCALFRQEKVVRLRWPDWERVTALAWSRDGDRLAVGTATGAISLFDLSKGLSA
jgi:WD40 repeat protein